MNTKRRSLLGFVVLVGFTTAHQGYSSDDGLKPPLLEEDKVAIYEENRETLQSWKDSDPLPTSMEDIGLSHDFELFESAVFGDGGSIFWIIRDEQNRYFAFYKERRFSWDGENDEIVDLSWDERRFWVGTTHPGHKNGGVKVPPKSKTEEFLLNLIKKIRSNQPVETTAAPVPFSSDATLAYSHLTYVMAQPRLT